MALGIAGDFETVRKRLHADGLFIPPRSEPPKALARRIFYELP